MLSHEDRSSRRDSRTEPVDVPRQSTGSATSEAHRPVI
jgi:hypothetical protein